MRCDRRTSLALLLLGAVGIGIFLFMHFRGRAGSEPVLRLCAAKGPRREMVAADELSKVDATTLVIVTHGWIEKSDWAGDLALAIQARADGDGLLCGWYD